MAFAQGKMVLFGLITGQHGLFLEFNPAPPKNPGDVFLLKFKKNVQPSQIQTECAKLAVSWTVTGLC